MWPARRRQRAGAHFSLAGLGRALLRGVAALGVAVAAYVTLVQFDVVRSPLDPSLGGDVELAKSGRPGLRVLFVGNSFSYENALPTLVRELAARDTAGPPIFVVSYTRLRFLRRADRSARERERLRRRARGQ